MSLSACGTSKLDLYPLSEKDVYAGKNAGDVCFSSYYLDEVMQVKIKAHK